jgi:hypothetical protein
MPTKPAPSRRKATEASVTKVRDPKTGRVVEVHGYGALRGQFEVRPGIDLTKPIYEQVLRLDAEEERDHDAEEAPAPSRG